ncbi:MAG: tRNA (guanosine(37)-N1)-methyltransferase TrmD [Gammaproteobacteria bacterium]|jgi:tRNA (guanine37-N1)-methyltransferase|nr:tRNA (guanosine(37)-N1)-methyltransferase TrmD [Gammaproteobacteria bacterium]MBT5603997.1 tRNA (guanosine(37)-N1)-methyltransferase TrmD [Gammaproteobacteria bacterium]MBT6246932.1 tRNA (guanosine(37)-N1)-methyltransferase TrmD [Gammaproteobacteria bacterium]
MEFAVVTLLPEMFTALTDFGITGRAFKEGIATLNLVNPRDFSVDRHGTVDDKPYGGGPGMLLKVEPVLKAVDVAKQQCQSPAKVIYFSAQGRRLVQTDVNSLAAEPAVIFIAGRYEGLDQRLIDLVVDEEYSIGDYVLSGGEIPAMAAMDAIVRLLPGVLGDAESAEEESFTDGLLEYPQYTRPESVSGRRVPEVLLSGDHAKIKNWRRQQSLGRTFLRRPDLLDKRGLSTDEKKLLEEFLQDLSLD